jgi:hypothetical protein
VRRLGSIGARRSSPLLDCMSNWYKFTVPPRPADAAQSNTSRESHGFYGPQDLLRGPFVVSWLHGSFDAYDLVSGIIGDNCFQGEFRLLSLLQHERWSLFAVRWHFIQLWLRGFTRARSSIGSCCLFLQRPRQKLPI